MRHIFNTIICLGLALLSCACSHSEEQIEMPAGQGVLSLSLDLGSIAEIDSSVPFELKIYRNGEQSKDLVRKYTSITDIPQYIWLIADNYSAQVKVGNKEFASFTDKYYSGSADFTIAAGSVASVEVECFMENIPVAVNYDSTIAQHFTTEYYTYVSAAESFNLDDATSGKVPTLKYADSAEGYFIMPSGITDLVWYFYGSNGDEPITMSGTIENVEPRKLYSLKFKYSKDAPGGLVITATVDLEPDYRQDNVPFSPDPTIKGAGFDAKATHNYTGGNRTYNIAALDTIAQINISYNGHSFDLMDSSSDHFTLTQISAKEYTVDILPSFFAQMYGGAQSFDFYVADASGGEGHLQCQYNIAGILPLTDYDLWYCTAEFSAMSFDNSATIGYRVNGGQWSYITANKSAAGAIYTATATDFTAGKSYEYALFADGVQVGQPLTITTPAGAQIPEADMEGWSYGGDNDALCPTANYSTMFWDTGNHALAALNMGVLTSNSTDVPSGSKGKYSAYMKSQMASIAGIGKFAAGNLFVGRFVTIAGMGGIVEFGRTFNFTARPKAIRFWMKNYQGTINQGSYTTGTDLCKIFCCLSDRKYTVNTNNESTYFTPTMTTEGVAALAYWDSKQSNTEWTLMELPIEYRDDVTTKPTTLVITFTCSGYGDYTCGSTDSYMYIDDIEFVY